MIDQSLSCFKAYDIRGRLGDEISDVLAKKIGMAYAALINPSTVVLGGDVRHSSESLKQALSDGLVQCGVNVIDLGITGTEEVYFATRHLKASGGIQVTASHNPIDFNGMKLVREDSKPIGQDTGLLAIKRLVADNCFKTTSTFLGTTTHMDLLASYVDHLLSYIEPTTLKPLKVVVNSGNGPAGRVIDAIESYFQQQMVPITFIKVHHEPNPNFPNGIPNPLLPENRKDTREMVVQHQADIGIAFDGDFDRCFFFDGQGRFIEGYYIVGLLASYFLNKHPGATIIHDPRLTWNTIEQVTNKGGKPVMSRTGHAFIKQRMRQENAVYGGEMSAHHYFRDFGYCDSGMIPWLIVIQLMSRLNKTLSEMVSEQMLCYPVSGEINRRLTDPDRAIHRVLNYYKTSSGVVDTTDGISIEFSDWRFNLRQSNTEPVVRLNVETRGNSCMLDVKTQEVLEVLEGKE